MPAAMAKPGANVKTAVPVPKAKRAPIAVEPAIRPGFRDRLSSPETVPRQPTRTSAKAAVSLGRLEQLVAGRKHNDRQDVAHEIPPVPAGSP